MLNPVTGITGAGGYVVYTDRTVTSATGASQTLMAANTARISVILKNGASIAGVNINGGTAVIGGAGTMTLQPYESLVMTSGDCPLGAMTIIGASGSYFSALEGTDR